jgi:hypothetical protein
VTRRRTVYPNLYASHTHDRADRCASPLSPLAATCPAGYICGAQTVTPGGCPPGYWCSQGTGSLAAAGLCPIGTYSSATLLTSSSQCTSCTPGWYCDQQGLQAPTARCAAGFMCAGGNSNAQGGFPLPSLVTSTPCSAGGWCAAGSVSAVPCPLSTYGSLTGYSAEANCTLCDDGYYCGTTGLPSPTGPCHAGHWCARGNADPEPLGGTTPVSVQSGGVTVTLLQGGDLCPPGTFCPAGSTAPLPCPNGTYWPFSGLVSSCATCPAGFWCGIGFTTYNATACPVGHYCLPGTQVRGCMRGVSTAYCGW